ncbi:hypothetical protein Tco_1279534 [Tanacetum coccineum]
MDLMNKVCMPYLDKFVIVFIDDILIYSRIKEEYKQHMYTILRLLKDNVVRKVLEVHVLASGGYYRRFIDNFSKIAKPLTELAQNTKEFIWGKLNWIYVRPFKILQRVSLIAYRIERSQELSGIHDVFHVSHLKRCLLKFTWERGDEIKSRDDVTTVKLSPKMSPPANPTPHMAPCHVDNPQTSNWTRKNEGLRSRIGHQAKINGQD